MSFPLAPHDSPALYLDLMKRCLVNWIYADQEMGLLAGVAMEEDSRLEVREWPGFRGSL